MKTKEQLLKELQCANNKIARIAKDLRAFGDENVGTTVNDLLSYSNSCTDQAIKFLQGKR